MDPGRTSGWASFGLFSQGYRLLDYGQVGLTSAALTAVVLRRALDARPDPSQAIRLLLESAYLPRASQAGRSEATFNWLSIEKLIINRSRWEVVAELLGAEVDVRSIRAQQWQGPVIGARRGMTRSTRKRAAKTVARSYFAGARFASDEADAVCMGLFEIRRVGLPALRSGCPARGERL